MGSLRPGTNWACVCHGITKCGVSSDSAPSDSASKTNHQKSILAGDIGENWFSSEIQQASPTPNPITFAVHDNGVRPTPLPPMGEAIGMENRIY